MQIVRCRIIQYRHNSWKYLGICLQSKHSHHCFKALFIFTYVYIYKFSLYHHFSASVAKRAQCTKQGSTSSTDARLIIPLRGKHGLIWVRSLCGSWQSCLWDSSAWRRSERLLAELELKGFQNIHIQPTTLPSLVKPRCTWAKQWKDHIVYIPLRHIQNKWIS